MQGGWARRRGQDLRADGVRNSDNNEDKDRDEDGNGNKDEVTTKTTTR